jgi:pyridoxamine 5'-phosphate oxidase
MDPFAEFREHFAEAEAVDRARLPEPTAMTLATVGADGAPSARIVLLKALDERGFVFYTNLGSRKGKELTANARAALVFHWAPLERQVRVEGTVERVTDAEADAYFATRARDSQVGAWASRQSEPLASDAELDAQVREVEARFAGRAVPRPPHWSGFRVVPERIEFWHGRAHRLHERRVFERRGGAWTLRRLFP